MPKPIKYRIRVKSRKIQLVLDKVLLLRLMRRLEGRFWGIFGLLLLNAALAVCFLLRPDLQSFSTAFSDFGTDIQTAPFFITGVFGAAYGLWRWRNYVSKSFKNPGIITLLLTLIIIGLYLVVFMPVGLTDTIDRLHYFGFAVAGVAMALTVVADLLLRRTRRSKKFRQWRAIRVLSLVMIILGFTITLLSADRFNYDLDISLVGEALLLWGFGLWVIVKTYQGEGTRSGISKLLNKVLIVQ